MLMRGAQPSPVVAADRVTEYSADGGHVAWIERRGSQWHVAVAAAAGGVETVLFGGPDEPHGVCVVGDDVYWLSPGASPAPDCGPLPALSVRTDVMRAPLVGGAPRVVARLPESSGGRILGVRDGAVYVSIYRGRGPGCTAFYRAGTQNVAPERVAAELQTQQALLAPDGALYWVAPSREATPEGRVCCVRRLSPDGRLETLSDWLPIGGALLDTPRGVLYADAEVPASVWRLGHFLAAPEGTACPAGYRVIAAGGGRALMCQVNARAGATTLYTGSLP